MNKNKSSSIAYTPDKLSCRNIKRMNTDKETKIQQQQESDMSLFTLNKSAKSNLLDTSDYTMNKSNLYDKTITDIKEESSIMNNTKTSNQSKQYTAKYDFIKDPGLYKKKENCFFCHIKFGSLMHKRHHCRLCANSVCGDCSSYKIQTYRICDVCYEKHVNSDLEISKKYYIKKLITCSSDLKKKTEDVKKEIISAELEKECLLTSADLVKKNNLKFLEDLIKSFNDLQFIYEKKIQEKNALSDGIKKRTEIINETNRMVCNLQNDISVVGINNSLISKNIASKQFRKEQLLNQ